MSQNLVATIINMVTPTLVDKVAAAVGISPDLARKGLTAVLPTILGLVASRAATPGGASQLVSALAGADESIGTNAIKHLTGPANNKLSTSGSDMLNSLVGGTEASTLVDTISRFTGTSGTAGSALAGIGTQLVMGQLARVASSQKLDAGGLASLLSSQQGAIQSALPAGLSSLLASTGSFGKSFSGAASAAKTAASSAIPPKPAIATGAPRSGPGSNLLMWLIPVALIAGAAWYYMSHQATAPVQQPAASTEQAPAQQPAASTTTEQPATNNAAATPAAPAMPDLGKPLMDAFAGATTALGTVTDGTTAKAALPAIESLQKLLDGSSAATAALSAEQKTALVTGVQPAIAAFKAAAEKVMALPGVGEVLKPAVDALLAKAASFPG